MSQECITPAISIIVPVYNTEDYLEQCLDSLVAQTIRDIEIIAIDDGSTDSSPQILERYAKQDSRIRVISKPNEGYGATMNRGIEEARADYVGFVESDDWPEPTMFERLYRIASMHDCDLVKCDFFDTFEDHEHPRRNLRGLPFGKVFDTVEHPNIMLITPSTWAALYRRSFLNDNDIRHRTTPGASFQDASFSLKCLFSARRCELLNRPLLHYRRDNPGASMKSTGKLFAAADEFAAARDYFHRDEQRRKAFITWARLNEWHNYRWEYERIAAEGHAAFLERVYAEMDAASDAGEIDYRIFADDEALRLKTLLGLGPERFAQLYPESFVEPARLHALGGLPGPCVPADDGTPEGHADRADGLPCSENLKVSIVMPAYNDEDFVRRAVASCLAQTHKNIEIICVDDCSTDDTLSCLRNLAATDPRIVVVALESNSGEHNARAAGVAQASGDLIMFLDADDELTKAACSRAVEEYLREPYDILQFAPHVRTDGRIPRRKAQDMAKWLRPRNKVLIGSEIERNCFVTHDHPHCMWMKAYPTCVVKRAFKQLGTLRADSGVDALEYFAITCNSLVYRGDERTNAYVYHLGNGLSALTSMGEREFERSLQGAKAIEGMRSYLESMDAFDDHEESFEAHRRGQIAFVLQTWHDDVRDDAKQACLKRMLELWDHDVVVDETCKLGSEAVAYLREVEGPDLSLTQEQMDACREADDARVREQQPSDAIPIKIGRSLTSFIRQIIQ